ncbi:GNAT family N-acetyltransferase [Lyngbya aestuarii]|uniref:GNAT family N-acetyltransferase n=1 Tax=Lyngbya aestuarii TaxID=118322 RepID=UPI00403D5952
MVNSQYTMLENAINTTTVNKPSIFPKSLPTTGVPKTLVMTYLQMIDQSQFRPAYLNYLDGVKLMCLCKPDVQFYRFLSSCVGKQWQHERLSKSDLEIQALLADPKTSIHVLYVDGAPVGYIEMLKRKYGPSTNFYSIEIVYFGLRREYRRRGLDKHLLSHGIAYAWNNGAQRLWVHTSNLETPYVLNNYLQRGFKVYRIEKEPMPPHYLLDA